jgi:4-amino-4-deoxy-L-arabinose transferase-like glycosyltransferase
VSGGDASREGASAAAAALLAILAIAASARFTGLGFGGAAPFARPDESRVAAHAELILRGEWRPPSFAYPALFPLVSAAIRRVTAAGAYTASRAISASAGVATVLLVFLIGRRLRSPGEGRIAALLLAVTHLHSRDSHFGVTDAALALSTTWVLLLLLREEGQPSLRRFALLGAAIGVAASVKQPAVWLAAPLAVLAFGRAARPAAPPRIDRGIGALCLAALCAGAAFLALNPFALLEPRRFLDETLFELAHKTESGAGFLSRGWVKNASFTLWHGLGPPYAIAALLGLVLTCRRGTRGDWIVAVFALAWYAGMGSGSRTFARYMLPITPLAALFAARAIAAAAARLPERARLAGTILATAAVASVSATRVALTDRLLVARDARQLAKEFIDRAVAPGERVLWLGRYSWPAPPGADRRLELRDGAHLEQLLPAGADPRNALAAAGCRFVVTSEHWLRSPFDAPPALVERLASSLAVAASFGPLRPGLGRADVSPLFDRHDFFYLPYAGFGGIERAGPFLTVFRIEE